MNIKNNKNIIFTTTKLIRYFVAIVFITAGLYRIFFREVAKNELVSLNLPYEFGYFIIALELICGILLFFNKWSKYVILVSVVFLISAIVIAVYGNFNIIISNLEELFVFNPTPTDIFLHLIYVILLLVLLFKIEK